MREIEIVGPADDDRFLLARDLESSETFHVVADRRLRSLYHADAMSAASQERPMNPLSPREIQSRVRHGASPEDLAALSDVPVDKIMGFALPVLAEREHIAERARVAAVRRRYTEGAVTLQEALRAQLTAGRLDDATWDAWRRDDGRWTVTVAFDHGEPADFIFDTQGRYVVADSVHASTMIGDTDDSSADMALAQALVDAGASAEVVEQLASAELDAEPVAEAETEPEEEHAEAIAEALTPVEPDEAPEPEAPGVADLESVALNDLFEDEPPEGVASLKRARDRRAMGQLALGDLDDYDYTSRSESSHPRPVSVDQEPEEPVAEEPDEVTPVPEPAAEVPQVIEAPEQPEAEEQPRPKKRERRRVPSWDEIMFGNSSP